MSRIQGFTPVVLWTAGVLLCTSAVAQPAMDIHLIAIERTESAVHFRYAYNATHRPGYDNQPAWLADSSAFLYTSQRADGQTDVYRHEIGPRQNLRVCATRESEYSPTPIADGRFSTVRVEMDGTQRLWSLTLGGRMPALLLPDVQPVGYHAWAPEGRLSLFVLGEPHALHLAQVGVAGSREVFEDIGRSLQTMPDGRRLSFVANVDGTPSTLRAIDPVGGEIGEIAPIPEGAQDHAWTPWGALWMTSGTRLLQWDDERWTELADWRSPAIVELTRLAVSPDGRYLALVIAEPQAQN